MKFELECLNYDEPVKVIYDNDDNRFYIDGKELNIQTVNETPKRSDKAVKPFSPLDPLKKKRQINILKIQLGMKCNYNCSYCSQSIHADGAMDSNKRDAEEFLKKLDQNVEGNISRIELWGGEPLVYIKLLKYLIPELRNRYPNVVLSMISNGSLLTKPIVDFLAENKVNLTISHDGPGQALRGPDPLKNLLTKQVWKYAKDTLDYFSFNCVISPANCDVIETRKWFQKNFAEDVEFGFEGIVTVHDDKSPDSRFSEDQKLKVQSSVFAALTGDDLKDYSSLAFKQLELISSFANHTRKDTIFSKCEMGYENVIAVDLKGNILTCHNTDATEHKIGELTDIEAASLDSVLHWSHRPKCNDCLVIHTCRGSCMYLDHEEFADTCVNEELFHTAIFAGAFYNVTGLVIKSAKKLA